MNTQDQNQVPKKTEAEFVEMMKAQFYEIESINENISDLKERAKAAGYDAPLLAKAAKALSERKADDIIDKNDKFAALVDKVRNAN